MDRKMKALVAIVCFGIIATFTVLGLFLILVFALRPSGIASVQCSMTGTLYNASLMILVANNDRKASLRDLYISLDSLPDDVHCDTAICERITTSGSVSYELLKSTQGWHIIEARFDPPINLSSGEKAALLLQISSSNTPILSLGGDVVYRGASMIGVHPDAFHPVHFRSVQIQTGARSCVSGEKR